MNEIFKILSEIRPDLDFSITGNLMDDRHLDSLDIIRLVSELETSFGVNIEVNEIIPENFNDARSIKNLIDKLK